jgi:hypothetical protein
MCSTPGNILAQCLQPVYRMCGHLSHQTKPRPAASFTCLQALLAHLHLGDNKSALSHAHTLHQPCSILIVHLHLGENKLNLSDARILDQPRDLVAFASFVGITSDCHRVPAHDVPDIVETRTHVSSQPSILIHQHPTQCCDM